MSCSSSEALVFQEVQQGPSPSPSNFTHKAGPVVLFAVVKGQSPQGAKAPQGAKTPLPVLGPARAFQAPPAWAPVSSPFTVFRKQDPPCFVLPWLPLRAPKPLAQIHQPLPSAPDLEVSGWRAG